MWFFTWMALYNNFIFTWNWFLYTHSIWKSVVLFDQEENARSRKVSFSYGAEKDDRRLSLYDLFPSRNIITIGCTVCEWVLVLQKTISSIYLWRSELLKSLRNFSYLDSWKYFNCSPRSSSSRIYAPLLKCLHLLGIARVCAPVHKDQWLINTLTPIPSTLTL